MPLLKPRYRINKVEPRKKESTRPAMPLPTLPAAEPIPMPGSLTRALRRVSSRKLQVQLLECVAWLVAALPALWTMQAVADWMLNLPWYSRLLLLLGDVVVLGGIVWWFGIRAYQRRWNLQAAALQVEQKMPALRSALISAVQLSSGTQGTVQGSPELVRHLLENVARRLGHVDLAVTVVKSDKVVRACKMAGLSCAIAAGSWLFGGEASVVLIQRILLSDKPLPTKTIVIPITRNESVPVGSDFTLSARAQGEVPRTGRVILVYTNGEKQEVSASPSVDDPSVFLLTLNNIQQSFRYRFGLNDGYGPDFTVSAKAGPILSSLKCTQTYPDYTEMGKAEMPLGNLSLLAGSKIRLEGKASQPLKEAFLQQQGLNQNVRMTVNRTDPTLVEAEFTVPKEGLTGFSISLINQDNIMSVNNTVYRVDLVQDKPPTVEIEFPKLEKASLLLRAKPRLIFSVRDDFQIRDLKVRYEVTRPARANGEEAPMESGEISLPLKAKTSVIPQQEFVWDFTLPRLKWTEGCNITYWVEAVDNNSATGPGIGQSPKKMISLLSEAEKRAELLEALGTKAAEIENISNKQKKTNESLDSTIRRN
ncbi:hypothetical protein DB346_24040 [Verrucomicrobia bacterium LW23]|nr:hypothetical protein DB346_24040 [Verrucomicrobia bacterium LW23]